MRQRIPFVSLHLKLLALVFLAMACADGENIQEEAAPSTVKGPPLELDGPQWTRVAPRLLPAPDEETPDDPSLRRAYGPADMKLGECAKRAPEGTITGERCPNGHVVFGPYVATPRNADVRVSFELRALAKLEFASDVVSNATQALGILEAQTLAAGETRTLAYQIHVTEAVASLEARVWVSSPKLAAFEIKNLTVSVQ